MIDCVIRSPEGATTYRELRSVTLPAWKGAMQILPGHAEAFVSLKRGNIVMELGDGRREMKAVKSGECHVRDDTVTVIL